MYRLFASSQYLKFLFSYNKVSFSDHSEMTAPQFVGEEFFFGISFHHCNLNNLVMLTVSKFSQVTGNHNGWQP